MLSRLFKKEFSNSLNSKKSYAQSGEDLIVKFIFEQLGIAKPSYLDIGAHHPFYLSNTALLYESGARGINIEPDPTLMAPFLKYRKEDINLNIGISDKDGQSDFFIMNVKTLNTFSNSEAEQFSKEGNFFIQEVKTIPVKMIATVLNDLKLTRFPEFLTVDAEGLDNVIVNEINYENNFPLVICIETLSFSNSRRGVKNDELIRFLISKNYFLYADTRINSIFVHHSVW